ncbi:hypothetical protein EDB81DRAFT_763362 [Dactylonectria macrodidyma]|uniref:Ankyrin repeat protein n=1 Tax=Dactylonectria macrodidyma TaxID=307937 RepID=A0A9P9IVS8_9HYPO|nr:hypothetical protein EDB81DRAFT_763362 [Dactylonectria macrodidyma]
MDSLGFQSEVNSLCLARNVGLEATKMGRTEVLGFLQGANFDFRKTYEGGASLLHEAASYGKCDAARFLLKVIVSRSLQDFHGQSPLDIEKRYNQDGIGQGDNVIVQGAQQTQPHAQHQLPKHVQVGEGVIRLIGKGKEGIQPEQINLGRK